MTDLSCYFGFCSSINWELLTIYVSCGRAIGSEFPIVYKLVPETYLGGDLNKKFL